MCSDASQADKDLYDDDKPYCCSKECCKAIADADKEAEKSLVKKAILQAKGGPRNHDDCERARSQDKWVSTAGEGGIYID